MLHCRYRAISCLIISMRAIVDVTSSFGPIWFKEIYLVTMFAVHVIHVWRMCKGSIMRVLDSRWWLICDNWIMICYVFHNILMNLFPVNFTADGFIVLKDQLSSKWSISDVSVWSHAITPSYLCYLEDEQCTFPSASPNLVIWRKQHLKVDEGIIDEIIDGSACTGSVQYPVQEYVTSEYGTLLCNGGKSMVLTNIISYGRPAN